MPAPSVADVLISQVVHDAHSEFPARELTLNPVLWRSLKREIDGMSTIPCSDQVWVGTCNVDGIAHETFYGMTVCLDYKFPESVYVVSS